MLELLLALPFLLSLVIALAHRASRRTIAWLAGAAPIGGLILLAVLTPSVLDEGGTLRAFHDWMPQIGLAFSLRLDGLAWMFAGLVLGIGALIVLYAHYYLDPRDSAPRFFAFLLLFMGAMLGMVLASNLLLLAIFWELTSISSFLLIGYWFHRSDAREGAQMALTLTGAGGLALLAGAILLGRIVGSYELDVVLASGEMIRAHALYPWACGLILLGAFTKSAQFPFHFWLPHAMAAPTPVSAYLHSATMVKAGVFLLARMHPALAGSDFWFYTVTCVGAATLLIGAWHAIFQHDLKGLLAYSTISHLGLITLLFGLSTPLAVVAGLFHILNHAAFKASLFMAAGIIDHECHTRDIRKLHGLIKVMPYTAVLALIAALAMAGIPLLNGFLSKEMFFALALDIEQHDMMRIVVSVAALLAGLFGVAYSVRFVHDALLSGDPAEMAHQPHQPPAWMRIPVEALVVICLLVGMAPAWTIAPVLHAAAVGVLGDRVPEYSLSIWHGFNLPLLMSFLGVAGGIALYFGLRRYTHLYADVRASIGRQVFRWKLERIQNAADWLVDRFDNGRLQRFLGWTVLAAMVMGFAPFLDGSLSGFGAGQPLPPAGYLLWGMLLASLVAVLRLRRQRLQAFITVGAIGLLVSLGFVLLSAPDLALTQLLVEVVTVMLVLLAMNYLPLESPVEEPLRRRVRDALIAILAGIGITVFVYTILTQPAATVAGEMLLRSKPEGGGTNVVNVILVDFRGFDTLGEIVVFGVAGLVCHALLRKARLIPDMVVPGPPDPLPIPNVVGRVLLPLAILVSAYLFLRGHNLPGGGFIAGLVLSVPLLLQYVLSGMHYVEPRIGLDYRGPIGWGLLIATATGLGSWVVGHPFMTSHTRYIDIPLLGDVPFASAMFFDIGVYLVVFGACMLAIAMLGHVRERKEAF